MKKCLEYLRNAGFWVSMFIYSALAKAQDMTNIDGVDDMLKSGQSIVKVAAKWGGIVTVISAALALGSGKLEGALAHTVCKVLIVIGLLIAAMTFFGNKISWGLAF